MASPIGEDLFAPEVAADPYAYFERLRGEDPVHWNDRYETWVITRYDDVVWMLRRPEKFSSAWWQRDSREPYPAIDKSDVSLWQSVRNHQADTFSQHDPPKHLAMRRVLQSYYAATSIAEWRGFVQRAVKELLDAAENKGSMDIKRDLATPLPVLVISEMLGIPESIRPRFLSLAHNLLNLGSGEPDRMRPYLEGIEGLNELWTPLVEERLSCPKDDIISLLASGEKKGIYTRHQVLINASNQFFAGHETTINMICNGTLALLQHPAQWELLKDDLPGRAARSTEECLRYEAPIMTAQRIALEEIPLRGKVLRKGDRIRWVISSANRDPEAFSNPDVFDITRDPNPHLAFGSGVHHCLGVSLARLEGQEVFKALGQRFPKLRLETDELDYERNITFRALKALPVTW